MIYAQVRDFPKFETYGLAQQLRRAAVSVLSNIAEGFMRGKKEYLQFLRMSLGSCAEIEAQLLLAKDLGYLSGDSYLKIDARNREVISLLITYLKKLGH